MKWNERGKRVWGVENVGMTYAEVADDGRRDV